jgi:hypothetical protein
MDKNEIKNLTYVKYNSLQIENWIHFHGISLNRNRLRKCFLQFAVMFQLKHHLINQQVGI